MTLEPWPIECADQLILGNPASNFAICCFWTKKIHLSNFLNPKGYAVIGNLYSRAGINSMLRNILANPVIRYLILTGKSLSDSEVALLDFFNSGVDNNWKIIGNGGQIDRDLPMEALDEVRKNVKLFDLRGVPHFETEFRQFAAQLQVLPPFDKPRIFPKTPPSTSTYPSEFAGFIVRKRTIFETWCEILSSVMTFGHISPTDYGLEQKEVLALLSIIENPTPQWEGEVPNWAPFKSKDIEFYKRKFFEAEKSNEVAYNYGNRLQSHWGKNQIELLASELSRSGHSRRALVSLWDPLVDSKSSEPPCIITIQAVVRSGRLHLTAYIRSNDMFRAYPLNATALAELQVRVAKHLKGIDIGSLIIFSFSAHIYSDCWDASQQALVEVNKLRKQFDQDSRGNFVFHYEDEGQLIADHYNPAGDSIQIFKANNAKHLSSLIAPFIGRIDHALYLGREINRLSSASKNGLHYEQDEVL